MATPAVVRYLKVSNLLEGNQYLCEWQLNSETDIDHYNIYISETNYSTFTKIGEVPSTINQFMYTVAKNWGIDWFFKVTAVNTDPTPLESSLANTFAVSCISIGGFPYEAFMDEVTTGDLVVNDVVVGTQDGVNKDFKTRDYYLPNSLEVMVNRATLIRNIDYTELGNNDFRFIGTYATTPPGANAYIRVNYTKA